MSNSSLAPLLDAIKSNRKRKSCEAPKSSGAKKSSTERCSSRRKTNLKYAAVKKMQPLIEAVKRQLDEPLALNAISSADNTPAHLEGTSLVVNASGTVIGVDYKGVLVNLSAADVEYCVGQRILFDLRYI